jgi:flavin reductase (DIM6/NTAB) family NADH-FMN oxidoreductase RutF
MVLWSLSKSSNYFDAVMSSDRYVINILSENNKPLSKKFSGKDRILESEYTDISQPQFPKIIDAIAHFNCEVSHRYEGGDHIIILGTVVDFKSLPSDEPLIFYAGEYRSINARQSNQ